jgi:hypothetical protein
MVRRRFASSLVSEIKIIFNGVSQTKIWEAYVTVAQGHRNARSRPMRTSLTSVSTTQRVGTSRGLVDRYRNARHFSIRFWN